jgi:hypothetical protein
MHRLANKFVHMAKGLALTGSWEAAGEYLREYWPVYRELPLACRAATTASSLADLQGNTDYNSVTAAFVESLRGKSVFDSVSEHANEVPLGEPILSAAQAVEGNVIVPRPISKLNLTGGPIEAKTAATVVVLSRTALQYSSGTRLMARELTAGTVQATDRAFLDGLVAFVGSNVEVAGSGGVGADVKTLLDTVASTGGESLFLVVRPELANRLSTIQNTAQENIDMTPTGGSVCGIRCLVSGQLPPADSNGHTVALIDAASLAFANGPIGLGVTDAGVIDLSDDPEGAHIVSLFQEDAVAVRASRLFGWRMTRASGVSAMSGVNW